MKFHLFFIAAAATAASAKPQGGGDPDVSPNDDEVQFLPTDQCSRAQLLENDEARLVCYEAVEADLYAHGDDVRADDLCQEIARKVRSCFDRAPIGLRRS